MDKEYITIRLPAEIYTAIEKRIQGTEVTSVEEYVVFALEEFLVYDGSPSESLSKEDEEEIKKKLKELGYLG